MSYEMVLQRLRREILSAEHGVEQVAGRAGISSAKLEAMLEGVQEMPLRIFVKLTGALGIAASDLLNEMWTGFEAVRTGERMPTLRDADTYGALLTFRPQCGWTVTDWRIVVNSVPNGREHSYPVWARLPDPPAERSE